MFLNTLTAEGKYPSEDWENFPLLIERKLSQTRIPFSQFFIRFLEYTSNFKHVEEKDDAHS